MKIIIWELPKKELAYLKKNCSEQFLMGKICIMTAENAPLLYTDIESGNLPPQEIIVISENGDILEESAKAGMITVAYQPPNNMTNVSNMSNGETELVRIFPQVDIVVEGFEEVDYDFLEKVYQRHHDLPWTILETERLIVRELALSDMDALFELYSYKGMTDYMEGLYSYEEEYDYQKAYIENMYRFFGYGMWLVFEKETGKLVGRAGIEHREEMNGELELGYAIGTPWQGRGYATEVCEGILKYAKEELGFAKICSLVWPENAASIQLLHKLGFFLQKEMTLDNITYKKYKKTL